MRSTWEGSKRDLDASAFPEPDSLGVVVPFPLFVDAPLTQVWQEGAHSWGAHVHTPPHVHTTLWCVRGAHER